MNVSFSIDAYHHLADVATRRALLETFPFFTEGYLAEAKRRCSTIQIVCADSEFGQFIARRVVNGCSNNGVRNLNVKLICDPRPCPEIEFKTKFDFTKGC